VAVILDELKRKTASRIELGDHSVNIGAESAPVMPESADSDSDIASPRPATISRADFEKIEGQIVQVSISHDGGYCTAVALAPEMH